MAAVKCMVGLLALLTISAWTEARVVKRASGNTDDGALSVSEQLEKANKNLNRNQSGIQIQEDIIMPSQRNADPCVQSGCKWPRASDGKVYVPYVIANQYSPKELNVIKTAINSFSASTCIRFIPHTNQQDYIHIKSLNGCYSHLGRKGSEQVLSLQRFGCVFHGTVQHELIHALGFHHEQRRSDRDKYIRVLLQNVIPGMQHNFNKLNTLNQGTPYDYNSVMHYGRLAFSKDKKSPTLVAVPNPKTVFGTAKQMSKNDINRINLLYCKK